MNIGRQLGSGGREIGERLAQRLNISFYDKELIQLASEESGLCREFFEKADERPSQGIMGGLFGMRFPFIGDGTIPTNNCLSNDSLFKVQSDVIRRLAHEKSCLLWGVVPTISCATIRVVPIYSFLPRPKIGQPACAAFMVSRKRRRRK